MVNLLGITENIDRKGFYYDNTKCALGGNTRRHYHDNYELYFLESGTCNYYVDNRYYLLRAGDLIFIPSGQIHQTNYDQEQHTRRLINCGAEFIPNDLSSELFETNYIFRNKTVVNKILEIFQSIEQEYTAHDDYSNKIIKLHTHRLFYLIARHKNENMISTAENKTIESVIDHIKKNYMHELSLFGVAQQHAVSAEHLSRAFKKELGIGFNEYVNALRLQKAEFMLRNEYGKSISEVAFACGFNDSNYFSYRFKKMYGVSPISLKRKITEPNDDVFQITTK